MREDICIEASLAFVGETLEPEKRVRACIQGGRIRVERGDVRDTGIVILPAFFNAHIHVLEYGFAGEGVGVDPAKLLPWPSGLKARRVLSMPCRAVRYLHRVFQRLRRLGYAGAAVFVEGAGGICRLIREVGRQNHVYVVTYGRVIENLEGCDGYGAPVLTDKKYIDAAFSASRRGFRVAAHVSETPTQALLGDYEYLLYINAEHAVHLLYAQPRHVKRLAEEGVTPVASPYSNLFYWRTWPQWLRSLLDEDYTVCIGSDNTGWLTSNPWELARLAYLYTRIDPAKIIKAFTVNAWRIFVGGCAARGLEDHTCTPLLVLNSPETVHSTRPLETLVSIGDVDMHYTILNPLTHFEPDSNTD